MADPVAQIQVYRFCPRCGSRSFAIQHAHLTSCRACGLNLYHNPYGAAGAILVDRKNRVLLVRRANEPAKGKLAFPGGFVDRDESAEQALRREVREEIGLDVSRYDYVCSQPNAYPFDGVTYSTLDIYYSAEVADFNAARPLDEVDEIVILPIEKLDIDDLAFESTKAAWLAFRNINRSPRS